MLETEPKIVEVYVRTGRAKLIFRHILDFGAPSLLASQAAECSGDQGKFWAMHELLFRRQPSLWTANVNLLKDWAAKDLNIEAEAFGACIRTGKHRAKVEEQYAAARRSGVRVRPTFDINGKRVQGAIPFDEFRRIIDSIQ